MSTVTYLYPGSGTNPATAAQAKAAVTQTVQVLFADADTTAVITHNYGYDTLALARGLPLVTLEELAHTASGTLAAVLSVAKATNTITLTKNSTATGSGGTWQVDIALPHSILMPNS